jgi:hypothetical protein
VYLSKAYRTNGNHRHVKSIEWGVIININVSNRANNGKASQQHKRRQELFKEQPIGKFLHTLDYNKK